MLQIPNTFGLNHCARQQRRLATGQTLALGADEPCMVVGEGSNLVPVADFDGSLIQLADDSLQWWAEDDHWRIRAGGGLNWHELVSRLVAAGVGGLENLALIPGTVGAAPVQNIGAYGIELKDRFESLDAVDLITGRTVTLHGEHCAFGYRDSVFKHQADRYLVTAVEFVLPRTPHLRLDYAGIREELGAMGHGRFHAHGKAADSIPKPPSPAPGR